MPTSVRHRAHEVAVGVNKFSFNSGPMYLLSVECGVWLLFACLFFNVFLFTMMHICSVLNIFTRKVVFSRYGCTKSSLGRLRYLYWLCAMWLLTCYIFHALRERELWTRESGLSTANCFVKYPRHLTCIYTFLWCFFLFLRFLTFLTCSYVLWKLSLCDFLCYHASKMKKMYCSFDGPAKAVSNGCSDLGYRLLSNSALFSFFFIFSPTCWSKYRSRFWSGDTRKRLFRACGSVFWFEHLSPLSKDDRYSVDDRIAPSNQSVFTGCLSTYSKMSAVFLRHFRSDRRWRTRDDNQATGGHTNA